MDIAVVGAGGVIGRQVVAALVAARLPGRGGRLQLIGRSDGPSRDLIPGMVCDLRDAAAEELPTIDVAMDIDHLRADVVVIAAGATITGRPGGPQFRRDLVTANAAMMERVAAVLAATGSGEEIVLVLTNPVEPMVDIVCTHIDRRRVIGLGAVLDTLRFRQEIANELGIRRTRVEALVLGEHGPGMLPCWSSVRVQGMGKELAARRIAGLRRPPRWQNLTAAAQAVKSSFECHGIAAAYALIDGCDAAWRTWLRPWVTQLSGARTPNGTAAAISSIVTELIAGNRIPTAAQVQVRGECADLFATTGVPVLLSQRGIESILPIELAADELQALREGTGLAGVISHVPFTAPDPAPEWLMILTVASDQRPGVIARIAAIVAERGINLDSIVAGRRHGQPTIIVACHIGDAWREQLLHRLRREPDIATITSEPARARQAWTLLDQPITPGKSGW